MDALFKETTADGWTRLLLRRDSTPAPFGPYRPLVQLWQDKAVGEDLPAWSNFHIRELAQFLPWLEVFDILPDPPFDATVRYWGTMVTKILGADLTGRKISETYATNGLDAVDIALLERIAREKRIGMWAGPIDWQERQHVTFTALTLPLSDDGKTVDKLMLCTQEGDHLIR